MLEQGDDEGDDDGRGDGDREHHFSRSRPAPQQRHNWHRNDKQLHVARQIPRLEHALEHTNNQISITRESSCIIVEWSRFRDQPPPRQGSCEN